MGLLGNIEAPKKYVPSCQVRSVMERLEKDDQIVFQSWLDATDVWSGAAIAETMSKQGFQVGRTAVNHHRRKACSCSKI